MPVGYAATMRPQINTSVSQGRYLLAIDLAQTTRSSRAGGGHR